MTRQNPPRVALVLTNHGELGNTGKSTGFYLSEAAHPYFVFAKSGFEVDFISARGGMAPMDGADRPDEANTAFLQDAELVARTRETLRADTVDASRYDAIFFVGGHGTMWDLPDAENLQRLTREIYERGGVVAAVCHGPAGLVNVALSDGTYLVKDKQVAAFTNAEEEAAGLTNVVPFALESRLRERGAHIELAPNFKENVVTDGRLVTGQNPASAHGVAESVAALLRAER